MGMVFVMFVVMAGHADYQLDPYEFKTQEACEAAAKLVLPNPIPNVTLECRPRHSAGPAKPGEPNYE